MQIKIRSFTKEDSKALAKIHYQSLDEGLMAKLGLTFLESYYASLDKNKSVFVLVALEGKEIVGFIAGTVKTKLIPKTLYLNLLIPTLMALCKKPYLIFKIACIPFYSSFSTYDSSEILSLAVKHSKRGKGVARKLVEAAKRELKKRNARIFTISVRSSLRKPNAFYRKLGLKKLRIEMFMGEEIVFWKGTIT